MFAESKARSDNMMKTLDKLVKLAQEDKSNRGQLPAATQENPKHVNAINLRSGTVVPERKAPEATPKAKEPEVLPRKKLFLKPSSGQPSGKTIQTLSGKFLILFHQSLLLLKRRKGRRNS